MGKDKQQFGQYMTPPLICDFMVGLISHPRNARVLEPSCGEGAFLQSLENHAFTNVTAYEIDKSLINPRFSVRNESFVSAPTDEKFDVIIGNPPYIRWKNLEDELKAELEDNALWSRYCNSLCDYSSIFIIKAVEQLNEGGELIFITPEYWITTTHAAGLRNYLLENGVMKDIYHLNETPVFRDVKISLIIFRFVKSHQKDVPLHIVKYYSSQKLTDADIDAIRREDAAVTESFTLPQFKKDARWILANEETLRRIDRFETACRSCSPDAGAAQDGHTAYVQAGQFFDIGNGMVSGLDRAFRLPDLLSLNEAEEAACIPVIKAKDIRRFVPVKSTRYLFIDRPLDEKAFKDAFPAFCRQLAPYAAKLKARYSYGRDIPYWEWVFLRNYALFSSGREMLFVPCKERITRKNRFRFCLAPRGAFPTQDVTALVKKEGVREDIRYALALFNSRYVFEWLSHKGIRKGDIVEFSEKPVASIPFRRIDFSNPAEVAIHDRIVALTDEFMKTQDCALLSEIDAAIDTLV